MRYFILVSLLTFYSCGVHNHNITGTIENENFIETLPFEERLGLVILPVAIEGETYKFLFDTGAPNAISEELQSKLGYKKVTSKSIRDSNGTKRSNQFVEINSLKLGTIQFSKINAFVTNFSQNPTISCLEIDGIIGSPLMRHCTWQIDYEKQQVLITDQPEQLSFYDKENAYTVEYDDQYSMKLEFGLGNASLYNIKLDYGSVNALTISNKTLDVLLENNILNKEDLSKWYGFKQSGLYGTVLENTYYTTTIDLTLGNYSFENVKMQSGRRSGGLFGTEVLSQYIVTLDYPANKVALHPRSIDVETQQDFGFRPAWMNNQLRIISTKEGGLSEKVGLHNLDTLVALDNFKLESIEDFCTYINREKAKSDELLVSYFRNGVMQSDTLRR